VIAGLGGWDPNLQQRAVQALERIADALEGREVEELPPPEEVLAMVEEEVEEWQGQHLVLPSIGLYSPEHPANGG
jgi:hypothetical protein